MKIREGSLKKAGVVMSFFAVGCTGFAVSCTGLDRHLSGTVNPYGNPNTPDTRSETAQRIRGAKVSATPVLPEDGDVWPGQPEPVPSLRDVSRSDAHFIEKWQKARPQLDADLRQQLGDGQGMSVGEDVSQRYGSGREVMPIGKPIASHVKDNAPPYMESVNRGIVVIPNGDGTDTLIAPDGSIKIVSHSKAALFEHAKTFGHGHGNDATGQPTYAQPDNGYVAEAPRHLHEDQQALSVPPALRAGAGSVPVPVPAPHVTAKPPVVSQHPQPKAEVVPVPPHHVAVKPPVVSEPSHPQPKAEIVPVPAPHVAVKPPVVSQPPHPQSKAEVVPVPHVAAKPPVVSEPPHPQPKAEVAPVPAPHVAAKPPVGSEPPHPQPKTEVVAGQDHPVRHKAPVAETSARHAHADAMVDAAHPVAELPQPEKKAHKAQPHKVAAAPEKHVAVPAKKEHHFGKKHGGDYVDALGFEAPVRHAKSHHGDGVYQFDWDK